MKLTIAIPTIHERSVQFNDLKKEIERQITGYNDIEIISICDNKGMSIGKKRQKLIEMASGEYIVMIDDDDWIAPDYIESVFPELICDCVGYKERCTIDGQRRISIISNRFEKWENPAPKDGIWYYRTPFFKVPIRTDLCLETGVKDLRYAEDHDFSKRIKPLIKTERFVDKELYYYSFQRLTKEQINERFGIKD